MKDVYVSVTLRPPYWYHSEGHHLDVSSLYQFRTNIASKHWQGCLYLKEHNHVFAHAQEFDFWTGGREFKDGGMVV